MALPFAAVLGNRCTGLDAQLLTRQTFPWNQRWSVVPRLRAVLPPLARIHLGCHLATS